VDTRKGYYPIKALAATGTGETTCFISARTVQAIEKDAGRKAQYYGLLSAAEVLSSPTYIYQGLKRTGYEDALCYVGRPARHGDGWSGPAIPGFVFVVFVTKRQVVFEWRWEKADTDDESKPEAVTARFTTLKWKHSSST